jgi:hypothetical protein
MVLCKACKNKFKNDHGLKRHRSGCRLAKLETSSLRQKRTQLTKVKDKGDAERQEDVVLPSLNKSMETEAVSFIF